MRGRTREGRSGDLPRVLLVTLVPNVSRASLPDLVPRHRVNRAAQALIPPFRRMNWFKVRIR